jgi:4-hydroxy-2-oxoheptanedioate aldolase
MYENSLKNKLASGRNVNGCIIQGALPSLVEIAGLTGFDFVFIDAEHGPLSEGDCEELIRAAEVVGTVPLVRVRENNAELILRYMDVGAMGIIIPGVRTKEDAAAAVRAIKYYPRGERGLSATRASNYGLSSMKDYVSYANEQTMVVVVAENMDAVDNIEKILAVDGLDAAIAGTTDLAQSLGHPGVGNHPDVVAAVEKFIAGGLRSGKPLGSVVRGGETNKMYFDRGFKIALASQYGLLAGAGKSFIANAGAV